MSDDKETLQDLKELVKIFCEERNWRQFHNAKELAIGISTEAGELLQQFRFKSNEEITAMFEDESKRQKIMHELADVLFFVLRFAEYHNLDLSESLKDKLKLNAEKYPLEKVKGLNKKYTEY